MLNAITIMGRFTDNPEVRTTASGISVCSFTIANDKDYKRDGDAPNWVDCVAWRQAAESIGRFFRKGSPIIIEGSLQTRQYQDKNGNNRKATEVIVNRWHFAESKRQSEGVEDYSAPPVQPAAQAAPVSYSNADASDFTVTDDAEDDLPF